MINTIHSKKRGKDKRRKKKRRKKKRRKKNSLLETTQVCWKT
jgi:hypothetical protein